MTDDAIAEVVSITDRDEAMAALVDLAHAAGGYDNITIVLADAVADGPAGTPAVLGAAEAVAVPRAEHTASLPRIADADLDVAPGPLSEADRYAPSRRGRPGTILKIVLGILIPLLALGGGVYGWYAYTQTQYFIAPADAQVAVYRGVPDKIFGLTLNEVVQTDTTRIGDLPPYFAERVRATIGVAGLGAAQTTLQELREKAAQCVAQREARARATAAPVTPAPASPTMSASPATPSVPASPGATPSASAEVSPAASATPVTSPEDC